MMGSSIRIIGIDPGLRNLGWGVIEVEGSRLAYVSSGVIRSSSNLPLAARLRDLFKGLTSVIRAYAPLEAAVEETFVNCDPQSALKLGQARGVAMVAPAMEGLLVAEYAANLIKKTVAGSGHAEKKQVALMVKFLLPRADAASADAADALAAAIAHAQLRRHPALLATPLP